MAAVACLAASDAAAQTTPQPAARPAAPAARVVSLNGTVYDSLARAPLAGATVQAVRADDPTAAFTTASDSAGRFRLDTLAPGRYVLGFLHPLLDVLGVEVKPLLVDLSAGVSGTVALAIPGPASLHAAVCPAAAGDSVGAVAGSVRDADTDAPAPNATVVLSWSEIEVGRTGLRTERRRVPVAVRPDGTFLACGVPADGAVEASATAPGRTSGIIEVAAPVRGLTFQRFALGPVRAPETPDSTATVPGDSTAPYTAGLPGPARGTARLTGRVVSSVDGRPVRGARVRVWGTAESTETTEAGIFALETLPSGTFTVEARAIGLEPTRLPVDLASGRAAEVRVAMPRAVPELERVIVRGQRTRAMRDLDGFLARRRTGMGTYLTQADIARRTPLDFTDVLRTTPGISVVPSGSYGNVLRGRAGCVPAVYLDGVYLHDGANTVDQLVRPQNVAAVEVYRGGAGVPVQFNMTGSGGSMSGGAACGGAVVIWTRR